MSGTSGYRSIATIIKTHGRKGEVVAAPCHGLPLALANGMRVAIVPPRLKGPRWYEVSSCSNSESAQCVALKGVDDLSQASKLVGRTVLACVDDLPEDFASHDVRQIIGRAVVDEHYGALGDIEEVMLGPANDVWVVRGTFGEVLIPVVEQVILSIPDEGPIRCDVPKGLVGMEGGHD